MITITRDCLTFSQEEDNTQCDFYLEKKDYLSIYEKSDVYHKILLKELGEDKTIACIDGKVKDNIYALSKEVCISD